MENPEINTERWVSARLDALQAPAEWRPDTGRAYARLAEVDRAMRRRRRQRFLILAACAAVCVGVTLVEAPKAYCAGAGCANQPAKLPPAPTRTQPAPQPAAAASVAVKPEPKSPKPAYPQTAPARLFKETGATDAPLTCEIYSDYECPHCAIAFRDVIPLLEANYVQSGKVRLVYRDFPLPQHPYARLAARFANAAGLAGQYETAVAQIFRTQAAWSATGDIDSQLAEVLPPGTMQKVREAVNNDPTLDDMVAADMAMARQDHIRATPSIVVVKDGRREVLSPIPSYELLKSYLDGLLGQR